MTTFRNVLLLGVFIGLGIGATKPRDKDPKTFRMGFVCGSLKVAVTYDTVTEKVKSKELVGCQEITIGHPDDWELVSVQAMGKETHCYNLTFRLRNGSHKLCQLDLRGFCDASRNDSAIELRFKDACGDISIVPHSLMK